MTTTARVIDITRTNHHDSLRTPLDVIRLVWDGKVYYWSSEPGRYEVGQDVPVNQPTSLGGPITPADDAAEVAYAGAVAPGDSRARLAARLRGRRQEQR